MKGVLIFCLWTGSASAVTSADRGPARVGQWIVGQPVPRRPHPSLRVDQVRLVQPSGAEDVPPPSHLEITTRDERTGARRAYVVTTQMAMNRGFSLDGMRYRLLSDGYASQINLRVDDAGSLVDFTLDIECDQRLSSAPE